MIPAAFCMGLAVPTFVMMAQSNARDRIKGFLMKPLPIASVGDTSPVSTPAIPSAPSGPRRLYINDVVGEILLDGHEIGSGGCGRVISASRIPPGSTVPEKVALKVLLKDANRHMLEKELEILTVLHTDGKHKGKQRIVKPIAFFSDDAIGQCVAFERLGKDLYDTANEGIRFTIANIRDIAKDVLEGLQHCHSMGIVHSDIKPENILIANPDTLERDASGNLVNPRVKLIDFGFACKESEGRRCRQGTMAFISPEVLLCNSRVCKSDIWSVAITLFSLRTYRDVFNNPSGDRGCQLLMMEKLTGDETPQEMLSIAQERYCDFLVEGDDGKIEIKEWRAGLAARLANWKVRDRIKAGASTEIEGSVEALADVVGTMMRIDPRDRASAEQALKSRFFAQESSVDNSSDVDDSLTDLERMSIRSN